MDKKRIFNILNISETKDINIIKTAYRQQLIGVNPEDDPEGFKTLREAYEEAVRLSSIEEELPDTPINRWIKKVELVYKKLSSRINVECWRSLFEEDVCKDFDTSEEVRDAFLVFIMDNYRLPVDIWILIEETFNLLASKEELYEKFPRDFVDFITEESENKKWMNYNLFEGNEEADVDGFIIHYLSIRRMNEYKEYDEINKSLDEINKTNLWHPYLDIERIRYYINSEKIKEADKIGEKLRGRKYDDLYIKYYLAVLSMKTGDVKQAYEIANEILSVNPDHYGAKRIVSLYYYETEDYKEAKDIIIELMELFDYDETLMNDLKKVNKKLIKLFKMQIEKEPDNKEIKLELGWCFFQNNRYQECLTLIKDIELEQKIYYEYYNLITRTYMVMENYEKVYPCVKIWLDEILKVKEKATYSEKDKKIVRRLPLAYFFMAKCYRSFAQLEKEGKNIDKCLKYLELAIESEKNQGDLVKFLNEKALILLKSGKNKLCIDTCDKIIELNNRYFPAYVYRQEAFFNLRMGKEVIDDYYRAVDIYRGYAKPYILAAKVFIIFERYEDAKKVLDHAKEANIESNELTYQEFRINRLTASTNEERAIIVEGIKKLYDKAQEEVGDLEDISLVLHELAICYYNMEEYELALTTIEKKLKIKKSTDSIELKGDILYYLEKYEETINIYKEVIKEYPKYPYPYYVIGFCYERLNNDKKALSNFLKVLELDSEHKYVNNKIKEIYRRRFNKYYNKEDYNLAVKYAKCQVKLMPNCYYYNELGLIYSDGYDFEDSIDAFKKAIEYDATDMYAYNNLGWVNKVLGNFDEAYKYYKLAIEHRTNDDFITHRNMATYYKITGQYEKAAEIYKEIFEQTKNTNLLKKLAYLYQRMGEWDKAIGYYKQKYEMDKNYKSKYWLDIAYVYSCVGDHKQALRSYKKAINQDVIGCEPYRCRGDYLLWIIGDKKKALSYYKKAYMYFEHYDFDKSDVEIENLIESILYVLKSLGKEKKGEKYLNLIYDYIRKKYGSVESWLNNPNERKERLYYLASWNYYIAQYEKTKYYMKLMKENATCEGCTYPKCHQVYFLEGMLLEREEDYLSALNKYRIALKIKPDDIKYISKVKEMKQKIGEK